MATGPKTVLAPNDAAVATFGENITDDDLKRHIFDGNLTAEELLRRSEITSINGDVFEVSHQNVSNRGRRAVVITVSNAKSQTALTVLDIPAATGAVHGIDRVLLSADDSSGSGSKSTSESQLGATEWSIIAICILFLLLLIAVALLVQRNARHKNEPQVVFDDRDDHTDTGSWIGAFNPMVEDVQAFNKGIDARSPPPRHYYPAQGSDDGESATIREPGTYMPATSMKSSVSQYISDYELRMQKDRSPGHYYPQHASSPTVEGATKADVDGRAGKRSGKLSTPLHQATRPNNDADGGYLDPSE